MNTKTYLIEPVRETESLIMHLLLLEVNTKSYLIEPVRDTKSLIKHVLLLEVNTASYLIEPVRETESLIKHVLRLEVKTKSNLKEPIRERGVGGRQRDTHKNTNYDSSSRKEGLNKSVYPCRCSASLLGVAAWCR